jgi:hypothetical protein
MVIKMLKCKKRPEESKDAFMKRLQSRVTEVIENSGIPRFSTLYWKAHFRWAGSLFQTLNFDPERVTTHPLRFKDLASIHEYARLNPRKRGGGQSQGHVGRVHVWRWETDLYNYFSEKRLDWMKVAGDHLTWDEHLDGFLDTYAGS